MVDNQTIFSNIIKITDNYGNIWTAGMTEPLNTGTKLSSGNTLTFLVEALDEENGNIMYRILDETYWQNKKLNRLKIDDKHISENRIFTVLIKSSRVKHRYEKFDDLAQFSYRILPRSKKQIED